MNDDLLEEILNKTSIPPQEDLIGKICMTYDLNTNSGKELIKEILGQIYQAINNEIGLERLKDSLNECKDYFDKSKDVYRA